MTRVSNRQRGNTVSDFDDLAARLRLLADEADGTVNKVTETAQAAVNRVDETVSRFRGMLQTIQENVAWIAGLPAVLGGGFGFLKTSADDAATSDWQMEQLTDRVAELEAGNDLLGGGTKNFSLNLGDAPGGSMTAAIAFVAVGLVISGAIWLQQKRRRR